MIFSSHILSEVQTICHQIIMIAHGRLVAFDTPENLEKQLLAPGEITLTALAEPERAQQLLAEAPGVSAVEVRGRAEGRATLLVRTGSEDMDRVCRDIFLAFAEAGTVLLELTPRKASLEDVFLELSEPGGAEAPAESEGEGEEK